MDASARLTRQLAAVVSVIGLAAGLAAATAGAAHAAVPDKWGFAFVSKPSVPGIPDLTHQAGSWPAAFKVHTTPGAAGRVIVTFPRIASKNGVVHVTAVNQGPVWCQAEKWAASGPNEVVSVRCRRAGGAPVFSRFTVLYTTSSKGPFPAGRAYGYVHFQPGGGVVATFNSAGTVNTVTPGAPGVWVVRMPGLGTPAWAGNVQVTAVNAIVAAKCEVGAWAAAPSGQRFLVRCYNGAATPLKTGWTLSYQRGRSSFGGQPKLFAYIFNNKPAVAGPYAPVPVPVNFNSAGGVNTAANGGGFSLVRFPRAGMLPNNVLVSPFKAGPGFCNLLTLWATSAGAPKVVAVRDVVCWTAGGMRKPTASLVTYTTSH
ncbi:MAG TPA: hypothetical protein VFQ44_14710 [Streptosporangiaceae bacterium]|nr:hypothetical protein [Streptosporangiaceae bacterium]